MANTQPTYDFITGNAIPAPATIVQPFSQSQSQRRQSTIGKADIGNEDLRAKILTLQYDLESFKQEREVERLRHDKEIRDVQLRAEETFKKAQVRITFL